MLWVFRLIEITVGCALGSCLTSDWGAVFYSGYLAYFCSEMPYVLGEMS